MRRESETAMWDTQEMLLAEGIDTCKIYLVLGAQLRYEGLQASSRTMRYGLHGMDGDGQGHEHESIHG